MYAWEAIQNSLDYIEDHLSQKLEIKMLSKVAGLSPYYFQRLFGKLVKKPVNEYVKLRRLAKASEELKNSQIRIVDIALEYGFSDHANFTRNFKESFGITPEEYRSNPTILNQFVKPQLQLNNISVGEDVPLVVDGMVLQVNCRKLLTPRIFIGIEGEVPETEITTGKSTGIATAGLLWDDFHQKKNSIPDLVVQGNELGIFYKGAAKEGCCTYFTGAEVITEVETHNNLTNKKYTSFILSVGEYYVCCFDAMNFNDLINSAIFKALTFMEHWIETQKLICGDYVAELYFDTNPEGHYMELWIPLLSSNGTQKKIKNYDIANGAVKPSVMVLSEYVNDPLFDKLCEYVESEYLCRPTIEFSKCSMQYGWNIKYKKAGRTLCTLYPEKGGFTVLIVIGERERLETELMLPFCTQYFQQLYYETTTGMGQKWLMIKVTDEAILEDVKYCIGIRRGKERKTLHIL